MKRVPAPRTIGRRKVVVGACASVLVVWCWPAEGAEPTEGGKVYRIGVIDYEPEAHAHLWKEFVAEFARIGYVEGRNVRFERRIVRGPDLDRLDRAALELVAAKVDLLFAARGTPSALAAKRATRSIPVVFFSSADPVGAGLVASLPRPGGNVTGTSVNNAEVAAKSVELLGEILGRRRLRVAQIQPRGAMSWPWFASSRDAVAAAADRLGSRFEYFEVGAASEIAPLLERLARDGVDAVTLESLAVTDEELQSIADRLIALRLASFGDPWNGQLFVYETDYLPFARIAAHNVDKILRGTAPALIPVQQPTQYDLTINLKTARALGLTIPEHVLVRAAEVIR